MKFVKQNEVCQEENYDLKSTITVSNFDEIKDNFLMDIKAVVIMEEVPDDVILN